jgi:hypothetical protein
MIHCMAVGLPRGLAIAAIATLVASLSGVATADAAVVSGSNLAAAPDNGTCVATYPGEKITCTAVNAKLGAASQAPGGTKAGIDGVIVGWRIKTGASSVTHSIALVVVRGTEGIAEGGRVTLPAAAGVYSYPAQIPVRAGDELGVDLYEVENTALPPVLRSPASGAEIGFWYPWLLVGESRTPITSESELLMNATIEPDADHDGYGDETQDPCPTVAGTTPCPSPVEPVKTVQPVQPAVQPLQRPDTAITRGPQGKIHSRTVVFAFRSDPPGASFECKFDDRKFKPCGSPRKYRHLGFGSHKFEVQAVNATGTDSIPATRSFNIIR